MLFSWFLLAQLASPPHLVATRVTRGPAIDGALNDAAWAEAPASSAFTQKYPDEGSAPSDPTTIRVLYDDDNLYVAFDCNQEHSHVVERLTRRDRDVESDRVTIVVGSRADRKTAFEFTVNASGSLIDVLHYNDTEKSSDWDEIWEARTKRTPTGWTAEFRIPLRVLRFSGRIENWDFQARRYISERQETDEWAYIPRSDGGEVSRYGYLDGLSGLRPITALEVRPFVVGKVRRLDPMSSQVASGTDIAGSAGVDAKWHLTPSLTLDATLNPDFAQVEADQQILNLTNYETYYPEKRPFFLEGIDLFSTPLQLLYTRRIGRAAPAPELRTDPPFGERLVDVPVPATIFGAGKLTGTPVDKWQIGTLQAVSGQNAVDVQNAAGLRSPRLVDPLSAYQLLRLKRELPGNGYVGALVTATNRVESTYGYPLGSPNESLCPSGTTIARGARCFNDAYVGSVDWRWRSANGDWVTGGQLVGSTLHNGPARPVRDGTLVRPGDFGTGARAFVNKEGGKHWVGDVDLEYEDRKLDYNDLGYNQRSNDYRWRVDLEYRELEKWSVFNESRARLEYYGRTNMDGSWLGSGYQANVSGKLTNFWKFFTEVHLRPAYFDDREVGDGTALQRAGLVGHELELSSDPTKRVSFKLSTQTQATQNGFIESGEGGLLLRAIPELDFELLPTWVYTFGEPRFAQKGAVPEQYIFGRLRAMSIGTTVRGTFTVLPTLTLQTYAQLFLASGHYSEFSAAQANPGSVIRLDDLRPYGGTLSANPDFQEGALNLNVVLRWEYVLGSTLYFVYTRSQIPSTSLQLGEEARLSVTSVQRAPAADVFLVKLTYWLPLG
jgi:hypothetical protein